MRQLLRSLAALGLLYATGVAGAAAEQALRDAGARRGAAAPPGHPEGLVVTEPSESDKHEFFCRHLMTELGRMEVRGFDTARAKQAKRDELDDALDTYNLAKALEA